MAEKNAATSRRKFAELICPICVEPVVGGTADSNAQDALFCGGPCQCWHHRWCASVSKQRYAALLASKEHFLCPSCTAANHQITILSLGDWLDNVTEEVIYLKAMVAVLQRRSSDREEIAELKAMVAALQRSMDSGSGTMAVPKLSEAWNVTGEHHGSDRNKEAKSTYSTSGRVPVPVIGARCVWGVLKFSTSAAVKTIIQQLSTMGDSIAVTKKYKTAVDDPSRILRWWFDVRGTEETLQRLEWEWPVIAVLTGWKLEPLYNYTDPTISQHLGSNLQTQHCPPSYNPLQPSNPYLHVSNVYPPHSSAQCWYYPEPPITSPAYYPAMQPLSVQNYASTPPTARSRLQSPDLSRQ